MVCQSLIRSLKVGMAAVTVCVAMPAADAEAGCGLLRLLGHHRGGYGSCYGGHGGYGGHYGYGHGVGYGYGHGGGYGYGHGGYGYGHGGYGYGHGGYGYGHGGYGYGHGGYGYGHGGYGYGHGGGYGHGYGGYGHGYGGCVGGYVGGYVSGYVGGYIGGYGHGHGGGYGCGCNYGYGHAGYASVGYGNAGYAASSYSKASYAAEGYGQSQGYVNQVNYSTKPAKQSSTKSPARKDGQLVSVKKPTLRLQGPADDLITTLKVYVPADAKVYLAGQEAKKTGTVRTFRTKKLAAGRAYQEYRVKVVVIREGEKITQERTIKLAAGATRSLSFDFDESLELASR